MNINLPVVIALMRRILAVLLFIFLFILLFWALNLKDPHLLKYRKFESATILGLCLAFFSIFTSRYKGLTKSSGLIMLIAAAVITLYGEASFHYKKRAVLTNDNEIVCRLGEHFIVGYDNIDELRPLLSNGVAGGVFITRHNAENRSLEELKLEISDLQKIRAEAGLPKLVIATDQEGGIVSRLSPPLKHRASLGNNTAKIDNRDDLLYMARKYGAQQGKELSDVGVTLNFSPVVDLKSDKPRNYLDFHSLIEQRSISRNPELTADVAIAYIHGLESYGVSGTLKHFPGLGSVDSDTHHFSAVLETPARTLAKRDWIPFQRASSQSNALIMLGHVVLSAMDNDNPVSFSRKIIKEIIRDQWKHERPLVTDDLTMGASYNLGMCKAVVNGLNAGVDLLLISYDHEKIYDAMYCAVAAYKKGKIDTNELELSHERIRLMSTKSNLL